MPFAVSLMAVDGTSAAEQHTAVTRDRHRSELARALRLISRLNRENETLRDEVARLRSLRGVTDLFWETFRLSPFLLRLLVLLDQEDYVAPDAIKDALGFTSDPRIAILRLRRKMAPWGLKIGVARGSGYYIAPEEKQRLRAIVKARGRVRKAPFRKRGRVTSRSRLP